MYFISPASTSSFHKCQLSLFCVQGTVLEAIIGKNVFAYYLVEKRIILINTTNIMLCSYFPPPYFLTYISTMYRT